MRAGIGFECQPFAGLRRDERGSLTVFSLFIIIIMLFAGGMAVDFMRQESERARLQSTLDRAVLAAADMDQTLDAKAVVSDYFAKSGLKGYSLDVKVADTYNARRVSAVTSNRINSYFLNFLGIDHLDAPAAGGAEESISNIEISLVLDVSGSMNETSKSGNTKIVELKKAAGAFVDTIYSQADPERTTISLIPYSTQVAVGEPLLSKFNVSMEHTNSSCVDFTKSDFSQVAIDTKQPLKRTAHFDPMSGSGQKTPYYFVCRTDAGMQIYPVSNDTVKLKQRINALVAQGNTSIDVATKWGSALLQPEAQPAIAALAAEGGVKAMFSGWPLNPAKVDTTKVLVIMTDGINTTQWTMKSQFDHGASHVWKDKDGRIAVLTKGYYYYSFNPGVASTKSPDTRPANEKWVRLTYPELFASLTTSYHAYNVMRPISGDYPLEWLGGVVDPITNLLKLGVYDTVSATEKDARLDAICAKARAANVKVYTVGFEVTTHSAKVLQACASSNGHAYLVDGLNITQAFQEIANDIGKLRLTQ